MKIYLIAGEASGDLHASNLVKAMLDLKPDSQVRAWAGDLTQVAGAQLVKHYKDLAFMGFWEVLKNLGTILANFRFCKSDILQFQPDVIVFVDYPGFNLRMAKWAKKLGFKTFYYISPQLWAWHSSRVHQIRQSIDQMAVILPFEQEFYRKFGMDVRYVGHPLADVVQHFQKDPSFKSRYTLDSRPIIALLPGSRKQEISKMLPVMLQMAPLFPRYQFAVAGAPSQETEFYRGFMDKNTPVTIIRNETYQLLGHAHAALVTSGTATLETALFGVPEIVCYKGSRLSFWIAKQLVKVRYISLVNLILEKAAVPELIQDAFRAEELQKHLKTILEGGTDRERMLEDFAKLKKELGVGGASSKTAKLILDLYSG